MSMHYHGEGIWAHVPDESESLTDAQAEIARLKQELEEMKLAVRQITQAAAQTVVIAEAGGDTVINPIFAAIARAVRPSEFRTPPVYLMSV